MPNENEKKNEGSACSCCGKDRCGGPAKWIGMVAIVAVVGVLIAKNVGEKPATAAAPAAMEASPGVKAPSAAGVAPVAAGQAEALPRLVDLGATQCVRCKMMAPILDDLQKAHAGKLEVEFIDVWENADAGRKYGINVIPTQIFFDAAGKERFRHEGFLGKEEILAKWKELGVDLTAATAKPGVSRWAPVQPDTRAKDAICDLCDGNIRADSAVVVKAEKGDVRLCGMHHYFVMYSCLTEDKAGFEKKVSVTDPATGTLVPIAEAAYVVGMDTKTGRLTVKAFAAKDAAEKERQATGGTVLDLAELQAKELEKTCGFCDRAVYPADAADVRIGDVRTWGCCSHCALGVAARTGRDIEVRERDRLTGEPVVVKTLDGSVASLEPATAVAWYGQRVKPDGSHASAGCFHQGFFANSANLRKWVDANPLETGEQIMIAKALADKMALTPQQISKACKIGECAPK